MKLGSLATIGAYSPANLIHVLLDNAVHDSTGGQPTVSPNVDFCRVAQATGYRSIRSCEHLATLEEAIDRGLCDRGPHFLHVPIAPGSISELGRPSIPPHRVAQRFRGFLVGEAEGTRDRAESRAPG
jgi:phosphonopyruvate decarboxylase